MSTHDPIDPIDCHTFIRPSDISDDDTVLAVDYRRHGGDWRTLLRMWDDGFGPMWIYSESLGVLGTVRARTWEDAHACVQSEIMDRATWDEVVSAIDPTDCPDRTPEGIHAWIEVHGMPDGYGYDDCGGIYSEDLNGSSLERMPDEVDGTEYRVLVRREEV